MCLGLHDEVEKLAKYITVSQRVFGHYRRDEEQHYSYKSTLRTYLENRRWWSSKKLELSLNGMTLIGGKLCSIPSPSSGVIDEANWLLYHYVYTENIYDIRDLFKYEKICMHESSNWFTKKLDRHENSCFNIIQGF